VISASFLPIRRAGITNTGRITSAARVICQDRMSIVISTRITVIRLDTTDDSVSVNACWAPSTSLLSLLISAPVWVLVKNASGMRWMCPNTPVRRSKIRLSPTRAETQRCRIEKPASSTARPPSSSASWTTSPALRPRMPPLMISR